MKSHHATVRTSGPSLTVRLIAAAVAIGGFVALLLASKRLGEDVDFLGLSDSTIHLCGHIGVYGTLAVLIFKAMGDRWGMTWVFTNALAAGEEWRQQFVPGRRASLNDEMVNMASITVALVIVFLIVRWRKSQRKATERKV